MPTLVALLKVSGKTEHAYERLKNIPRSWNGVMTREIVLGTGGYDAVVLFEAPNMDIAQQFVDENLRDSDPLTIIDTVIGKTVLAD